MQSCRHICTYASTDTWSQPNTRNTRSIHLARATGVHLYVFMCLFVLRVRVYHIYHIFIYFHTYTYVYIWVYACTYTYIHTHYSSYIQTYMQHTHTGVCFHFYANISHSHRMEMCDSMKIASQSYGPVDGHRAVGLTGEQWGANMHLADSIFHVPAADLPIQSLCRHTTIPRRFRSLRRDTRLTSVSFTP